MKTVHVDAQARLDSGVPRLSTGWIIKLANGTILRFTSHDQDVTFAGQSATTPNGISVNGTYEAAVGYRTGALQQGNDGSVDNMEVRAILQSSGITARDLQGGLYNGAEVYLFGFFWDDLTIPIVKINRGFFGEYSLRRSESVIEFRDMQSLLHQRVGRTIKPLCDADFGDARCGFDLGSVTQTGTVSSVTDRSHISLSSVPTSGDYQFGVITFTSGNNSGLSMEIKGFSAGGGSPSTSGITLFEAMPYLPEVGDGYSIVPGCNKIGRLGDCLLTYDNYDNFQGFEDVPGVDKQLNPDIEEDS